MDTTELLKQIINLPPEQFREVRKAMVERLLGEPTKKELVQWIFQDFEAEMGDTTLSLRLKQKYELNL